MTDRDAQLVQPSGNGRPGRIQQAAVDVVALLGGVVARLRTPLLLVSLAPLLPGLVILLIAAGSRSTLDLLIPALGLIPSAWLTVRRRQLVGALQPPEAAVAELRSTFNLYDFADQLKQNLLTVKSQRRRMLPRRLAGGLWRGVKLGAATWSQLTDVPRLAPFLPGRLRGLAFLIAACLISALVQIGYLAVLAFDVVL